MAGVEGDVEVMLAGQAGALDLAQRLAHHAAQRILRQQVVSHQVFGHARLPANRFTRIIYRPRDLQVINLKNESAGFCCQVPANPA